MVGGADGFDAVVLARDLFVQQMETVERSGDGACVDFGRVAGVIRLAGHSVAGGGGVLVAVADELVQVVQAIVPPDDAGATVAEEVLRAVVVLGDHFWLASTGLHHMPFDVGQPARQAIGSRREAMPLGTVVDPLGSTEGVVHPADAAQVAEALILEVPTGLLVGRQHHIGQLVGTVARQGVAGPGLDLGVVAGVQVEQYLVVAAVVDGQQVAATVVAHPNQPRLVDIALVLQAQAVA
ncbi:hypothetical protein D3C80_1136670 [compost metagenome]